VTQVVDVVLVSSGVEVDVVVGTVGRVVPVKGGPP
jgi:hypothetical protein